MKKILIVVGVYGVLSVVAFVGFNESLILSAILGPAEHLSILVHTLDNADQYLDGVSRVTRNDIFWCSISAIAWIAGLVLSVLLALKPRNKVIRIALVIFWVLGALLNVFLFSIRSV